MAIWGVFSTILPMWAKHHFGWCPLSAAPVCSVLNIIHSLEVKLPHLKRKPGARPGQSVMRLVTCHRNAVLRQEQVSMDTFGAMPPLPLKTTRDIQKLETELRTDLSVTVMFSSVWDEYLRTYVTEMYEIFYAFYSRFEEDKRRLIKVSVFSAASRINVLLRAHFITEKPLLDIYNQKLLETVTEHALRRHLRSPEDDEAQQMSSSSTVAAQLCVLKDEGRLSAQALADGIGVNLRTVQRHLTGEQYPRAAQILAYENFLSEKLRRLVKLETP